MTVGDVLIRTEQLAAGYDAPVVRGLDLTVRSGEIVALLGPNGAGKSTTLLAMTGAARIFSGRVTFLDEPVRFGRSAALARAGLIHVPEDRALFPSLTVGQNLAIALRRDRRTRRARFERALDLLPALRPIQQRPARLLSGGEQQMLALARAVAAGPKLLVVDEMSMGLAPIIVQRLLPLLRTLADEDGVGVLMVEQHLQLGLAIADRGYVLNHGTLTMMGDAADLRNQRSLIASSYMGDVDAPLGEGTGVRA